MVEFVSLGCQGECNCSPHDTDLTLKKRLRELSSRLFSHWDLTSARPFSQARRVFLVGLKPVDLKLLAHGVAQASFTTEYSDSRVSSRKPFTAPGSIPPTAVTHCVCLDTPWGYLKRPLKNGGLENVHSPGSQSALGSPGVGRPGSQSTLGSPGDNGGLRSLGRCPSVFGMIARELCGLVAQCRACLEADCSFALVRQRVPASNDTKKEEKQGYLKRAARSGPYAQAVP